MIITPGCKFLYIKILRLDSKYLTNGVHKSEIENPKSEISSIIKISL
jgi:hypothetical protein